VVVDAAAAFEVGAAAEPEALSSLSPKPRPRPRASPMTIVQIIQMIIMVLVSIYNLNSEINSSRLR